MRKWRTGVVVISMVLAASIAVAEAAAKKKKPAEPEDLNANGKKLVMDGLPLIMPSAVMLWMLHNKEVEAKQQAAQAKPVRVAKRKKH